LDGFAQKRAGMEFFQIEISEQAERLDYNALTDEERGTLFQGLVHNPATHDIFRILLSPVERPANPDWSERQKRRKRYDLVDRILVEMQPGSRQIRIAGIYPASIAADGAGAFDFEAEAGAKILEVADARLRFAGPIKNWWRKRCPLVVAQRTDRVAQWVYSRDWITRGSQCQGELLCEVPKSLTGAARSIQCYADFKDSGGRAVERSTRRVKVPDPI
jgi:hypothetical protein